MCLLDLPPGAYETGGGSACLWTRMRDFASPLDAIESGVGRERSRTIIEPTDAGCKTDRCERWVGVSADA